MEGDRISSREALTQYRDAFSELWYDKLIHLSNEVDDIAPTLERGLLLQGFNVERLGFDIGGGTPLRKFIGVNLRKDPETDKVVNASTLYPSFFRQVLRSFEYLPALHKYFHLSVDSAMELPMDQWYMIRAEAERIAGDPNKTKPDTETLLIELIRVISNGREASE